MTKQSIRPIFKTEALAKIIREELYSAAAIFGRGHRGAAWKEIGARCEPPLSAITIDNLVTGKTRFPRFSTVIAIFRYLGYELTAIKRRDNVVAIKNGTEK